MNQRTVALQTLIFSVQWALMIVGVGLLAEIIAPIRLIPSLVAYDRVLDSEVKTGTALVMSVFWLYLWDRQVRRLVFKRER